MDKSENPKKRSLLKRALGRTHQPAPQQPSAAASSSRPAGGAAGGVGRDGKHKDRKFFWFLSRKKKDDQPSGDSNGTTPGSEELDPWSQAYENLRRHEPGVVQAYEQILTSRSTSAADDVIPADAPNKFEGLSAKDRMERMTWVLNPILQATKKDKTLVDAALLVDKFVTAIGNGVEDALENSPPLALAWSGICLLLPVRCWHMIRSYVFTDGNRLL
jgi:N-terminal domain of NWD NACHT-NTPase